MRERTGVGDDSFSRSAISGMPSGGLRGRESLRRSRRGEGTQFHRGIASEGPPSADNGHLCALPEVDVSPPNQTDDLVRTASFPTRKSSPVPVWPRGFSHKTWGRIPGGGHRGTTSWDLKLEPLSTCCPATRRRCQTLSLTLRCRPFEGPALTPAAYDPEAFWATR